MKKILFKENFFDQDNERSFYWAGMLAADGSLNSTKYRKTTSLTLIEKEMIESFLSDIECIGRKISERHYTTQKGPSCIYSIVLSSLQMYDSLHRFGLTERKSLTLKMPEWLKTHPLVHHFVRGYFDGDGSVFVQRNSKYIEFRGTIPFLDSINEIIKSNISSSTRAVPHTHSNCGSLKYTGNILVRDVGDFLYKDATIWLDRKRVKITA